MNVARACLGILLNGNPLHPWPWPCWLELTAAGLQGPVGHTFPISDLDLSTGKRKSNGSLWDRWGCQIGSVAYSTPFQLPSAAGGGKPAMAPPACSLLALSSTLSPASCNWSERQVCLTERRGGADERVGKRTGRMSLATLGDLKAYFIYFKAFLYNPSSKRSPQWYTTDNELINT